ncbi:Hypothetical predicted protein [Podarcis lilfordi]|uniref:Uncharacterized protein n=1 Tax=Podarcis lilfordi TaxID=74358 RepID=A0AA35LDD6_9SAUR|nr:Hypothetical predicted protein [Podarcis lilfordi]
MRLAAARPRPELGLAEAKRSGGGCGGDSPKPVGSARSLFLPVFVKGAPGGLEEKPRAFWAGGGGGRWGPLLLPPRAPPLQQKCPF